MERPSPKSAKMGPASMKQGVKFDEQQFGPHIIKMGQYDDDMLDRVVQKYKKMGHTVQKKDQIIKLNLIQSTTCLQEEMMATYTDHMDHSDIIRWPSHPLSPIRFGCKIPSLQSHVFSNGAS